MDAERESEIGDTVDHPLVKVKDHRPLDRRLSGSQFLDEGLLGGDGGITGILDKPIDQSHTGFHLRHEAERQQDLRPVLAAGRE